MIMDFYGTWIWKKVASKMELWTTWDLRWRTAWFCSELRNTHVPHSTRTTHIPHLLICDINIFVVYIWLDWILLLIRWLCLSSLYLGSSTLLFFLYTTFVICKNIINLYQFFISVGYFQSSLASWTYVRSNDETCCKSTFVIQRMSASQGPYICMLRLSISLQ